MGSMDTSPPIFDFSILAGMQKNENVGFNHKMDSLFNHYARYNLPS